MWQDRRMPFDVLKRRLREQPLAHWLSPAEIQRRSEMSSTHRRLRWLGGRWLAKQLLRELLDDPTLPMSDLHIESRDPRDRGSRPRVLYRGRLQAWRLTISHSTQSVYVAASTNSHWNLGVDIVDLQPLDDNFTRFWFSSRERAWCRHAGNAPSVCVIWSLKESWYKAAGRNHPFTPRRIDVTRVTPIDRLSGAEFSRTQQGEFAVHREPSTIICRKFPEEITTLVLHRGGHASRPERPPEVSSMQVPIRQK